MISKSAVLYMTMHNDLMKYVAATRFKSRLLESDIHHSVTP